LDIHKTGPSKEVEVQRPSWPAQVSGSLMLGHTTLARKPGQGSLNISRSFTTGRDAIPLSAISLQPSLRKGVPLLNQVSTIPGEVQTLFRGKNPLFTQGGTYEIAKVERME